MAVTIVRPGDRRMSPVRPRTASGTPAGDVPEERLIKRQVICDDRPYAHVVEVPARHVIAAHSHSQTEVTVVLSGTARIAGSTCEAGSVIVVPANEEYSIEVGEELLTLVVMRPGRAEYRLAK
jgi:hypothetical protein